MLHADLPGRDSLACDLMEPIRPQVFAEESLYSIARKTLQFQTHFGLSSDDNEFFIDRILRDPDALERKAAKPDPKKESRQRIVEAAAAARKHVEDITASLQPTEKVSVLHRWLDFLESGARVIWVEVADQKTAFRIFETMNDRGLKLSAADLLKNYLYSLADKKQSIVVQKWQGMVAVLESLGPDNGDIVDYIRYYWITGHGHTRSNVLFDEIKREVTNEAHAVSWSTQLELRAHDYAALYTSSHDAWTGFHPEVRARVETLRFLGVTQVRPLLLAAFGKFSDKQMEKLLAAAVNWSVRVLLTGVPSGTLEGHYSKNAKKVTDGAMKTVDALTKEMPAIIPDDGRFKAAVATAVVPDAQLARYYLRVLQMQADGAMNSQYVPNDGKQVTLEHILPVKPGPEWINISTEDVRTEQAFDTAVKEKQTTKKWPIAIEPSHIDRRIAAQGSKFMLFGIKKNMNDSPAINRPRGKTGKHAILDKIIVTKRMISQLRAELNQIGINEQSMFPDLEGLGKHISWEWKTRLAEQGEEKVSSRMRVQRNARVSLGRSKTRSNIL